MTLTVLQIIPALGTGGAEQACVDIGAALVERGDRAIILSAGGWRVAKAEKAGIKHIVHPVATKNPLKIIKNGLWLAGFIRSNGVDVVHVRSRAPAWSARIACHMTGCPFVTTFHAVYKFSNIAKKLYNRVMTSADRVIAISPFVAEHIKEFYKVGDDRLRLINRGIDLAYYNRANVDEKKVKELRQQWGVEEGQSVLLLPARLSPIKGHAIVLEALKLMKKEGRAIPQTIFVGDDQGRESYSSSLKDMIETEGLDPYVKLVGACDTMPAAYALATVVLQPSQIPEGFGRVPVEAMAMEIPVIASNFGGMRQTVQAGVTGWLVAPRERSEWRAAIEKALALSDEARKEMGQAGRRHVARYFSKTAMVARTLAVYDELVRT